MEATLTFAPITVQARRALLDALEALQDHREALVLVGAHAVYLYTGEEDVAVATQTKDADLAVIPAGLALTPQLEEAMARARFSHDPRVQQPGEWISPDGIPVELLVPAALHTGGGRRAARIPPHSDRAARVVTGLEAAAVDNALKPLSALDPRDPRVITVKVASPSALVVAKLYKIGERQSGKPGRLLDKDAHDLYRLLRAVETDEIAEGLSRLRRNTLAGGVTARALDWMRALCSSPEALVPAMAGRAEQFVGSPPDVAEAMWAMAQDVLDAVGIGPPVSG